VESWTVNSCRWLCRMDCKAAAAPSLERCLLCPCVFVCVGSLLFFFRFSFQHSPARERDREMKWCASPSVACCIQSSRNLSTWASRIPEFFWELVVECAPGEQLNTASNRRDGISKCLHGSPSCIAAYYCENFSSLLFSSCLFISSSLTANYRAHMFGCVCIFERRGSM
jgi:hypothetical protein